MRHWIKRFTLQLAAAFCLANAANATTITFDSISGGTAFGPTYSESGFLFSNSNGFSQSFLAWADGSAENADPDGNTLSHNISNTTTTLTKIGGGSFTFNSIDLADVYNNSFHNQGGNVQFSFLFTDGIIDTQTVAIDGNPGLETFSFNLSNLLSVAWMPQTTFGPFVQFDNVVLDSTNNRVPEPGSTALLGLGLAALAASRRRKP